MFAIFSSVAARYDFWECNNVTLNKYENIAYFTAAHLEKSNRLS